MDISLTQHDWIFLGWFFSLWFIASFIMLILYCMWEDRRKNKYDEFTVKDIFVMILFAPFTIVCGIIFAIMWFIMRVLHVEDLIYAISDFMNTTLKIRRKKKDE